MAYKSLLSQYIQPSGYKQPVPPVLKWEMITPPALPVPTIPTPSTPIIGEAERLKQFRTGVPLEGWKKWLDTGMTTPIGLFARMQANPPQTPEKVRKVLNTLSNVCGIVYVAVTLGLTANYAWNMLKVLRLSNMNIATEPITIDGEGRAIYPETVPESVLKMLPAPENIAPIEPPPLDVKIATAEQYFAKYFPTELDKLKAVGTNLTQEGYFQILLNAFGRITPEGTLAPEPTVPQEPIVQGQPIQPPVEKAPSVTMATQERMNFKVVNENGSTSTKSFTFMVEGTEVKGKQISIVGHEDLNLAIYPTPNRQTLPSGGLSGARFSIINLLNNTLVGMGKTISATISDAKYSLDKEAGLVKPAQQPDMRTPREQPVETPVTLKISPTQKKITTLENFVQANTPEGTLIKVQTMGTGLSETKYLNLLKKVVVEIKTKAPQVTPQEVQQPVVSQTVTLYRGEPKGIRPIKGSVPFTIDKAVAEVWAGDKGRVVSVTITTDELVKQPPSPKKGVYYLSQDLYEKAVPTEVAPAKVPEVKTKTVQVTDRWKTGDKILISGTEFTVEKITATDYKIKPEGGTRVYSVEKQVLENNPNIGKTTSETVVIEPTIIGTSKTNEPIAVVNARNMNNNLDEIAAMATNTPEEQKNKRAMIVEIKHTLSNKGFELNKVDRLAILKRATQILLEIKSPGLPTNVIGQELYPQNIGTTATQSIRTMLGVPFALSNSISADWLFSKPNLDVEKAWTLEVYKKALPIILDYMKKWNANDFKKAQIQNLPVIPKGILFKIFDDDAKGIYSYTKGIDNAVDLIIGNVQTIYINGLLSNRGWIRQVIGNKNAAIVQIGITSNPIEFAQNVLRVMGSKETVPYDSHYFDRFYPVDKEGNHLVSDNATDPLVKNAKKLMTADTYQEKVFLISLALNVMHFSGDISRCFAEGGLDTLNKIGGKYFSDMKGKAAQYYQGIEGENVNPEPTAQEKALAKEYKGFLASPSTGTESTYTSDYILSENLKVYNMSSKYDEIHSHFNDIENKINKAKTKGEVDEQTSSLLQKAVNTGNTLWQNLNRELYNRYTDITSLGKLPDIVLRTILSVSDLENLYDSLNRFPIFDKEFDKIGEVDSPMKILKEISDIVGGYDKTIKYMIARRAHFSGREGQYLQDWENLYKEYTPEENKKLEPIAKNLSNAISLIISGKVDNFYFPLFAELPEDLWSIINPSKHIGWNISPQDAFKDVGGLGDFIGSEMRRQRVNYLNAIIAVAQRLEIIPYTEDVPEDVVGAIRKGVLTFRYNNRTYTANLAGSRKGRRIKAELNDLYVSMGNHSFAGKVVHLVNNFFVATMIELNPVYALKNLINDAQTALPDVILNFDKVIKSLPHILGKLWEASSEIGLATTETRLTKAERYLLFPRLALISELFWRMLGYDIAIGDSNNVLDAEATFASFTGQRRLAGESTGKVLENIPIAKFRIQAAVKAMSNMLFSGVFNHSSDPKVYDLLNQIINGIPPVEPPKGKGIGTARGEPNKPIFSKNVPNLKRFLSAMAIKGLLMVLLSVYSIKKLKQNEKTLGNFMRIVGDKFNALMLPVGENAFVKCNLDEYDKIVWYFALKLSGFNPSTKKFMKSIAQDFTTDFTGMSVLVKVAWGLYINVDVDTGNPIVTSQTNPKQAPVGSSEEREIAMAAKVGVHIQYQQLLFVEQKLTGGLLESLNWFASGGQYSPKALPPDIATLIGKFKPGSTYNQKINDFFDVVGQMEKSKSYKGNSAWISASKGYVVQLLGNYNKEPSENQKATDLLKIETEVDSFLKLAFKNGFKPQLYYTGGH